MSGGPVVRLQREIAACAKDAEISGVNVLTVSDSLTHLRGTIVGPKDSPYEGGVFHVDIRIGEQYPFAPPKMQFITKVWHPNVSSQTGAICLDILKGGCRAQKLRSTFSVARRRSEKRFARRVR